jgi:hypothetical protein
MQANNEPFAAAGQKNCKPEFELQVKLFVIATWC